MKVSVPHIPKSILEAAVISPSNIGSLEAATQKVAVFVRPGNLAVLTGAGVSVDSGIRAYRGHNGSYMNPNYRPIFYQELIENSPKGQYFRKRYWCRSYVGYPPISRTKPNPTHFAISALQYTRHINKLVTQNVDGLHFHAKPPSWSDSYTSSKILELHGTLHTVHCRYDHITRRDVFQSMLSEANPKWKAYMDELEVTGSKPRTNPDGDVELEGVSYDDFVIPECEQCLKSDRREPILKPSLVFFGDTVKEEVKDRSFRDIEECDRLLLVGTTLATYSAFRLFKRAFELSKPIMMLNMGPTRADPFVDQTRVEKIEWRAGEVLKAVAMLIASEGGPTDQELEILLSSGIVTPLEEDSNVVPRTSS